MSHSSQAPEVGLKQFIVCTEHNRFELIRTGLVGCPPSNQSELICVPATSILL